MASIPTRIWIEKNVNEQADTVFTDFGMDMFNAVNIFLRQCILCGGLPFSAGLPKYNQEMLDAMAETRRISRDPDVTRYSGMKDLKAALESED